MAYFVAFLLALVSYTLIDNVLLSRFYGICSFIGVGNKVKSAVSMGIAVVFVIVFSALICYPIYHYVLVPAGLKFMWRRVLARTSIAFLRVGSAIRVSRSSVPITIFRSRLEPRIIP